MNKEETVEHYLAKKDPTLATVIQSQKQRWPLAPTEDPIWGLVRIVLAQQIATHLACTLAERVLELFPGLDLGQRTNLPTSDSLRSLGITSSRADCCVRILMTADVLTESVNRGESWRNVLSQLRGIGPWTISTFEVMVLREPDVLPLKDVGLERAVRRLYGEGISVEMLSEAWRPFRSAACWYLWRTLGNRQLG